MDHRRIQWLFLIIYFLIDLFLAFQIIFSPLRLDGNAGGTISNISSEIRLDGITLPSNLSHTPGTGYYLAAKDKEYLAKYKATNATVSYDKSSKMLEVTYNLPVELDKKKDTVSALNTFKNNIWYGNEYTYDAKLSSNKTYVYVQTSQYGDVYDNSGILIFTVRKHAVVSFTQTYIGALKPMRELQMTISSWKAISNMYINRELVNNSHVLDIKLGYSKMTSVRGSTIMLPTWIVWIQNKDSKDITVKELNAFTGQIIQNSELGYKN
ncbi:MAG: two-component system regulatory protein YycI [Lactobacillus sp.]|nr:two-component system regulatory protein YycI [Lactobacillus sp.]